MQSGQLEIEDGIGPERRTIRFARVGHGLKRLVCISEDGFATLSALKWIAHVGASFAMLNRTGRVLFMTGPTASSDVRLRRAQALAHSSGAALRIARELIDQKLAGQEQVARDKLLGVDAQTGFIVTGLSWLRPTLLIEYVSWNRRAAAAYWSAMADVADHFSEERSFPSARTLAGLWHTGFTAHRFARLAVNPPNAILNYLYSLLESESRLAAAALGLDPGMGVLHVDTKARDSLACDLMEPVRPQVDAFLLDWIMREPLKREWFFEQSDGNCRLMANFAARLSETAPMWGRAVAPLR